MTQYSFIVTVILMGSLLDVVTRPKLEKRRFIIIMGGWGLSAIFATRFMCNNIECSPHSLQAITLFVITIMSGRIVAHFLIRLVDHAKLAKAYRDRKKRVKVNTNG